MTSIAQDAFNRRLSAASIDRARHAALVGGTFGAIGGYVGRKVSNDLSTADKGKFGEALSIVRSKVRGLAVKEGEGARPRIQVRPSRKIRDGYTVPDHISMNKAKGLVDVVEAKFGEKAHLSKNQELAYLGAIAKIPFKEFLDPEWAEIAKQVKYRVDHFLPRDVGAALGLAMGQYLPDDHSSSHRRSAVQPQSARK